MYLIGLRKQYSSASCGPSDADSVRSRRPGKIILFELTDCEHACIVEKISISDVVLASYLNDCSNHTRTQNNSLDCILLLFYTNSMYSAQALET